MPMFFSYGMEWNLHISDQRYRLTRLGRNWVKTISHDFMICALVKMWYRN